MLKTLSFGAVAIAQYIYQNNTSAKKERPQEIHFFSIFLDTQLNKNYSKVLSRHGTELWMPDFYIILFSEPSVKLTTDSKKWQIFMLICVLMIFDHMLKGSRLKDAEVPVTSKVCVLVHRWPSAREVIPHSHCLQWFPRLGGPRGKHPWQKGLTSQTGLGSNDRCHQWVFLSI